MVLEWQHAISGNFTLALKTYGSDAFKRIWYRIIKRHFILQKAHGLWNHKSYVSWLLLWAKSCNEWYAGWMFYWFYWYDYDKSDCDILTWHPILRTNGEQPAISARSYRGANSVVFCTAVPLLEIDTLPKTASKSVNIVCLAVQAWVWNEEQERLWFFVSGSPLPPT